ncbi:hypothetical protein G6M50_30140 [Agrobacterium rhizogenes]|nr:hypothetical protein [Rhizobium rhizogenes]NTJ82053.1 hypothetical protein [Rhizobium rhizogenes]
MNSISDIVVAATALPERIISREYDAFLFFEIDLRSNSEFYDHLQKMVPTGTEISIFYSQNLRKLGETKVGERWAEKVKSIVQALELEGEYFGLTVVEGNGAWVVTQDIPVSWGVMGFKSSQPNSMYIYDANATDGEWFLSLDHFRKGLEDPSSSMRDSVPVWFMKALIANYGG